MADWEGISTIAQADMTWLGNFRPTVNVEDKQIKGYMSTDDECGVTKTYLSAAELRVLAASCIEVADYLDRRALKPNLS